MLQPVAHEPIQEPITEQIMGVFLPSINGAIAEVRQPWPQEHIKAWTAEQAVGFPIVEDGTTAVRTWITDIPYDDAVKARRKCARKNQDLPQWTKKVVG